MARSRGTLEQVRVAAPCRAAWDRMEEDERVRFCGECRRNVYNLSAMSRAEAEALVFATEGRVCIRFYQRRDGTVLTHNCPVGLRKARVRVSAQTVAITAFFAAAVFVAPWFSKVLPSRYEWYADLRYSRVAEVEPIKSLFQWLDTTPVGANAELRRVITSIPPPPVMGEYIADPKSLRERSDEASQP